jgi:hypothetical protein
MAAAWRLWFLQVDMTAAFRIDAAYNILASPSDQTNARFFLTDPREELKYLRFSKTLMDLERNMSTYSNIVSLCGTRPRQAQWPYLPKG